MIRPATVEDKQDIARLLIEFGRVAMDTDVPLHDFEDALAVLIENHVVLVSDTDGITGIILGQYIEHPFWRKTMLQEVAWYATDNTGGALLREFIRHAKEAEADAVYLMVLDSAGARIHSALQRMGFEPLERSYIMKL